jgi:hypothetical protein
MHNTLIVDSREAVLRNRAVFDALGWPPREEGNANLNEPKADAAARAGRKPEPQPR